MLPSATAACKPKDQGLSLRVCFALVVIGVASLARAQSIDPAFNPGADGQVYALAAQSGGRTLVAGAFRQLAGRAQNYLGRLNADASFDATFVPGLNGVVRAVVVQPDGKILISGQFTTVNGQTRNRIARLNADGSLDTTFNPGTGAQANNITNGEVACLALQTDGKILLGGGFETVAGQTRDALARLNPDGSLDAGFAPAVTGIFTSNPNATPGVLCLALQDDGKILVGGQFLQVSGQTRNGFARVNADGSLDLAFNPSATPANFGAVAVQPDGKILIGGGFSAVGGAARRNLARLNPDGSADAGFFPTADASAARFFVQDDGRILVSGYFTEIGAQSHVQFARLSAFGTIDSSFDFDLVNFNSNSAYPVGAFLPQDDGTLLIGGNFNTIGGVARNNLARLTRPGPSRLVNLSARGFVATGGDLTVGTVTRGGGVKSVMLRAAGPALGNFGVSGALADPQLEAIPPGATLPIATNNDWGGDATLTAAFVGVGAFAFPIGSKDSALASTPVSGGMTVRVTSAIAGGSGIALAEIYDRDAPSVGARLVNVSVRGFVGTGTQALVPGFVISGQSTLRLLIRAVGPTLATFNVSGVLSDPQLAVVPLGTNTVIASNDNWNGSASLASEFVKAGAFPLPLTSKDAALVAELPPGAYTVVVSGVGGATGQALVELYDLDP